VLQRAGQIVEVHVSTESKLKAVTEHSLFGPPLVIEGENAAGYDELVGRICAAVRPVDVIYEIFVADLAALEWDVLRWRRLKSGLIQARGLKALEDFLRKQLDYNLYREHFEVDLTEILQDNLKGDQAEAVARMLAHDCAWNKRDAVDKVNAILDRIGTYMNKLLQDAKSRKAEELAHEYVRRKPGAVRLVHKLLADVGLSIDALIVQALPERELDYIERIDRLATLAENRRNACLREIDRRRAVLAEALRRKVQEVEDGEFQMIETTQPKEKDPT
jgi:hypothetical protein